MRQISMILALGVRQCMIQRTRESEHSEKWLWNYIMGINDINDSDLV